MNKSLNLLRTRRRWTLVDGDAALERAVPDVTQSTADNELLYRQLYDAIAELNPDHAQILILRYMHGKTEAEIAKMFGVSRGTIAVKLFRSRARLRKLLRARLGEKP